MSKFAFIDPRICLTMALHRKPLADAESPKSLLICFGLIWRRAFLDGGSNLSRRTEFSRRDRGVSLREGLGAERTNDENTNTRIQEV